MNPADVLEAAADALFVNGRAIGRGREGDGSMCVLGAICHVQGKNPHYWSIELFDDNKNLSDPAAVALSKHLMAEGVGGANEIWQWNDFTRDDAYVINTLRVAAKDLRNRGES